jgi:hypothetical protein
MALFFADGRFTSAPLSPDRPQVRRHKRPDVENIAIGANRTEPCDQARVGCTYNANGNRTCDDHLHL